MIMMRRQALDQPVKLYRLKKVARTYPRVLERMAARKLLNTDCQPQVDLANNKSQWSIHLLEIVIFNYGT